ncbi:hypothetical protein BpJC4_31160 [Weizmannia acidilactici]|nr:hypothetical protein BpJC4_31160 [Weizmannia acidilactici]
MGNTSEKRKSYNAEFKEMVVELYQTGTPVNRSAANMACLKRFTNGSENTNWLS